MLGRIVVLPNGQFGRVVGYWTGDDVVQVEREDGYHEALKRTRLGQKDASTKQKDANGTFCVNCN